MRRNSNSRSRLWSSPASIFCSTAGRACEGVMLVLWRLSMVRAVITCEMGFRQARGMIPYLKRLRFNDATGRQDRSSPQDASHGPAHDGAANRTAHPAPERFSDVCRDLACHTVGDRTGDFASDDLAGGQALSAR